MGWKVYVCHGLSELLPQFFESEGASLEIASALSFTLRLPEACQGGGCSCLHFGYLRPFKTAYSGLGNVCVRSVQQVGNPWGYFSALVASP